MTRSHQIYWWLFACVMAGAVVLRLANIHVTERTPDERVYMSYSAKIAENGPAAVAELVAEYNRTQDHWIYPPPTRVGFTFLIAAVMKVTGASAEHCGVWISFAFSLVTVLLTGLLGWRVFPKWIGLIAMAFVSVSPLDLTLARRLWQDSTVAAFTTLLFCFCFAAVRARHPRLWQVLFWVVGAWFLLVKESALIIYSLLALWLLFDAWKKGQSWRGLAGAAGVSGLVIVVSSAALIWISGGPREFFQVYPHMLQSLRGNEYVFLYQVGPWYSYPLGLWVLSPVTTLLCGIGIGYALLRADSLGRVLDLDNDQLEAAFAMALFICAILVAATLPEGYKCLRYVSAIEAPSALLAAMLFGYFLRRFQLRTRLDLKYLWPCLGLAVVLLVCIGDYKRFHRYIIANELDDLAIVRVVDQAFVAKDKPSSAPPTSYKQQNQSGGTAEANTESLLALSYSLYQRGSYHQSISVAIKALQRNPGSAEAWNNIGVAYNALGQFDQGAEACEKALALKPDFPLARRNLAFARRKLDEKKAAQSH